MQAKEGRKKKVKPFNPRKRAGQPRKDRAAETAQRSKKWKDYNKGSKLRNALRGDDVIDVEEFLKSCEPPLSDLTSFLDTFEVRHSNVRDKKLPVEKRVPKYAVIPYRLSESMVRDGLALIDHKTPFGDTMDLSTPPDTTVECWVLTVDGIGDFTQRQLMAMQYVWSLVKGCKEGMQCYSWLLSKVDVEFADEGAAGLAIESWPYERLLGFGDGFHLDWTHVYYAHDKCWYNDNFINAFMVTLADKYENNSSTFLPPMKTPAPNKGKRVPPRTLGLSLLSDANTDLVFMPLNINGSHWTCLVVDRPRTTIYCYDSLDKRANQNLLADLVDELARKSLAQSYQITPVHSPIQKDGDNCGLFICLYIWRRFFKAAGNDYTPTGLPRCRWDILRTAVNFSDASKDNKTAAE